MYKQFENVTNGWLQLETSKISLSERIRFLEVPHYNTQKVLTTTKNYKALKETAKYGPFTRGKKKELSETIPEKAQILELLVKNIK